MWLHRHRRNYSSPPLRAQLQGLDALTLDKLWHFDHLLVSPQGGGFEGSTDRVLAEPGRSRSAVLSVPSLLLAPAAVIGSERICVLPERIARLHRRELDLFELPIDIGTFDVQLIWHAR